MVAGSIVFILVSSNPSLAIFVLFCLYALSGYVYQLYLFMADKPNPVIPGSVKLPEPVSASVEKVQSVKPAEGPEQTAKDEDKPSGQTDV